GPNGAGKSTFINLVTGVVRPSAGSVRFRDEDVTSWPTHALFRRGLARTFQTPRLAPRLTLLESVLVAHVHLRPLPLFRSPAPSPGWGSPAAGGAAAPAAPPTARGARRPARIGTRSVWALARRTRWNRCLRASVGSWRSRAPSPAAPAWCCSTSPPLA